MDARIEETIKNLKRRGFEPYYLESRAQVLPLVQKLVPAGSSVSHGGSETLKEVGVIDLLSRWGLSIYQPGRTGGRGAAPMLPGCLWL